MAKYWVVRADWDIQELVETRSLVGIGWHEVGDFGLSSEGIGEQVRATYPSARPGTIRQTIGQLRRFAHQIEVGDIVLTPIKATRQVLVGKVTGPYQHNPAAETDNLTNTRAVEWLRTDILRDDLSNRLRNSLAGQMTVFSVNDHASEIAMVARVIDEEQTERTAVLVDDESGSDDSSVADYLGEVEAAAREQILYLLYGLDGHEFEDVVGDMLRAMGFTVRGHGRGPDKGVDLVATPDALGFGEPRIKVQVKRRWSAAGRPEVQQLAGTLRGGEKGLFVSWGGFTAEAQSESSQSMTLVDGEEFVDLLLDHYEKLSPETRTRVPLKRLYVPVG